MNTNNTKSISYIKPLFYPLNYGALVLSVLICANLLIFSTCNPAPAQSSTKSNYIFSAKFLQNDDIAEKTMKYKFVFNYHNKLNLKGKAPLHLYINKDNKKYFHTKIYLKPTEWDGSKVIRHDQRNSYNSKLLEYENYLDDLTTINKPMDQIIKELEYIRDGKTISNNFLQWANNRFNDLDLEPSTMKQHKILLDFIDIFDSDITFSDIDYSLINKFQVFLQGRSDRRYKNTAPGLSDNYITSLLTILSSYMNEAVREGLISSNPVKDLKKKKTATEKEYLNLDEIKQITDLDLSGRMVGVHNTHSIFLFDCYTGLRLIDLIKLRRENIKNGVLTIIPHKTKKYGIKVVLPLDHLFWGRPSELLRTVSLPFTIPDDSRDYIQEFVDMAGINKKIGWHSARHSCAMNLLDLGFTLSEVQKILGHKSIQTTEIYARMRNERVSENIINRFKDIEDKNT